MNNYWLKKWNINDTNTCTLCHKEVETLDHMIWNCEMVANFWVELKSFIHVKFSKTIAKQDIYYGSEDMLLNMLTIIAKQYVYDSNRKSVKPAFKAYVNRIMYIKKIEEIMYKNNNRFEIWVERWKPLHDE